MWIYFIRVCRGGVLLSGLTLIPVESLSQSLTFAETHPVNNPDSLEQWIKANPNAPALLRLKAMCSLENTYHWNNRNRVGKYLTTINTLVSAQSDKGTQAIGVLVRAKWLTLQHQRGKASALTALALRLFQETNDTSGIVQANLQMAALFFRSDGEPLTTNQQTIQQYIDRAQQLLRLAPNPHAQLRLCKIRHLSLYATAPPEELTQLANEGLTLIRRYPSLQYAQFTFLNLKAIAAYMNRNYETSYRINQQAMAQLTRQQLTERVMILFNLGNDCKELKRYAEALQYYQKAIDCAEKCTPKDQERILHSMRAISYVLG